MSDCVLFMWLFVDKEEAEEEDEAPLLLLAPLVELAVVDVASRGLARSRPVGETTDDVDDDEMVEEEAARVAFSLLESLFTD